MSNNTNDRSDQLNLQDRELLGLIEAIDKRIANLEHDLWIIRSKLAESEKDS